MTRAVTLAALVGCAAPAQKMPWPEAPAQETPTLQRDPPPRPPSYGLSSRDVPPKRACLKPGLKKKISLSVHQADLVSVLVFLADEARLNLVVDADVKGSVTTELRGVTVRDALDALMATYGLDASIDGCVLSARMR
ncbi:MAG: hypothetical protein AAFU77_16365 [Myxococcota bacterium]